MTTLDPLLDRLITARWTGTARDVAIAAREVEKQARLLDLEQKSDAEGVVETLYPKLGLTQ